MVMDVVSLTIAREIVQLDEFFDDLFSSPTGHSLRDTGMQMAVHQESLELLNGLAHRIGLPQDIHAILILFNHFADSAQVSLNVIEPLENLLFISLHLPTPCLFEPPGEGYGITI